MNNMKLTHSIVSTLVLAGLLSGPAGMAQQPGSNQKKVTLGDLLRRAKDESRGSKINQIEKKATAVPNSNLTFEKSQSAVNLNDIKPPETSRIYSYENADQAAYERTLDSQIKELYQLTQRFKDSPNRGELWLRLAELYVEKSALVDARKQKEYDQKLKEFQSGRSRVRPTLETAEARDYNKRAIQLYEWFLRDYPNDPKVSQALFFLGYNNFEIGEVQKGSAFYSQLTSRFPNSPFAGDAHFAVAENLFENEKWADAYKEYSFLIKDNKHNLHLIALYKGAWCLYRTGKTEDGIKYLDYIVKSGARNTQQANRATGRRVDSARLENEALKDLVIFFADSGDTNRALSYFKNVNGKEYLPSIERLAYVLSDKGNREGSREAFRYLISREPNSKKAFEYQYQIVQNYFFAKNSPEFKNELYKWITNYNSKSQWYNLHSSDRSFIVKSNQLREQTLRNYILQQHQTAQNSRAEFSRQSADEGYKLYFQEFGNSPSAADMRFFYGELLYDMKRYSDAANEYTVVVNRFPNSQYAEKSSQNILLALEKTVPTDAEFQRRTGNSLDPVPLDEPTKKFIATSNWYLQKYPKSEKAAEIKFRVGRIYYLTNNFEPAEKQFREIVQQHPRTTYSEYSANLLLDIYNLKQDYVGLEKIGSELLADSSISNAKLGDDIRGVIEKASFKQAQTFELDKKYTEAANQYQSFGLQNPKSNLAAVAFFNAGVNFERAGKTKDAASNYQRAVATNSAGTTAEVKSKAKRLLAKIKQDAGSFEEAAVLYSDLYRENPKDPLAPNFLYNAALMKEIAANPAEAFDDYNAYIKINTNKAENAEIVFKMADQQRRLKMNADSLSNYRRYLELPEARVERRIEAQYWVVDLSAKLGQRSDLSTAEARINTWRNTLQGERREAAGVYLAKIRVMQSQQNFQRLKEVTIPNVPSQQKVAIDKKLEIMAVLNEQLGQVIQLASPEEIVDALYILGEANEHMALSIRAVPIPENIAAENRQQYLDEVNKIVMPFATKADESYKLAIERGQDLMGYNTSYQNAYQKMSQKYPDQYYSAKEAVSGTRVIDWGVKTK